MFKFRITHLLFYGIVFLTYSLNAQIGIGTPNVNENSDLHLANKNRTLILNHVDNLNAITDPYDGMIFYDTNKKCFRGYANGKFTECFGGSSSDPIVNVTGPGFQGDFIRGVELENGTFQVTINNNSFNSVTINFNINDLLLDQSEDIQVVSVYEYGSTNTATTSTTLTIGADASTTIVYKLSGTPTGTYTQLNGIWKKLTLEYSDSVTIKMNFNCDQQNFIWTGMNRPFSGLRSNVSYEGVYRITYNMDATGYDFPASSQTIDGLTLYTEGAIGSNTGEIVFYLTGVYTGEDNGFVNFNVYDSCNLYLGFYKDCKQILDANRVNPNIPNDFTQRTPALTSGVYKIDVDGYGGIFPMDCYCDMVFDNGGWTLVLNYNHKANTNTPILARNSNLPLLGSTTLNPTNNEYNTMYWGHAQAGGLLTEFSPKEIRFYARSSAHSRIMHFKTKKESIVNSFKNSSPNFTGINVRDVSLDSYGLPNANGFYPYAEHNTTLPQRANRFGASLTDHSFYEYGYTHWNINASAIYTGRWEVDNYDKRNGAATNHATIHQIWIR